MLGVKTQVGGVGRPWRGQGHRQARRELRFRNFSAEFLSTRQAAVCTALCLEVEDGDGDLVPTHPGKVQTSPAACGRQAWRPHSQAFNTHEIITLGAAAVAVAATLFSARGPVRQTGPDSERTLNLYIFRCPAGGARRHPLSQSQGSLETKGGEDPCRDRDHWPERDPESGCLHPTRSWDQTATLSVGRICGPKEGQQRLIHWPQRQLSQAPCSCPHNLTIRTLLLLLHLPLDRSWWCPDSAPQGAKGTGS